MKKLFNKLRSSMAANIIGAIVIMLVIFGAIVSTIGYLSFTKAFKVEYADSTYHMANTAATLVKGDHLTDYLEGKLPDEYQITKSALDIYVKKMGVTMVYVIRVDQSDYGRFTCIFDLIDNTVDDTEYVEWEMGHKRDTTNDEYRQKYEKLYNKESPFEVIYRYNPPDGIHPHVTAMVPVTDSVGNVTGILCMQRPMNELEAAKLPFAIHIGLSTLLLAVLSTAFVAMFVKKQVVAPVKKASDEATRFAKENTLGESLGQISRFDEISSLANSIDTMESDMVKYMENLTAVTAENQRVSTELTLASQIQEGMLPSSFPAFPDRHDFDIFASMDPAREVGGDFYNFFMIDDDHLCMMIADVSGKGVPAALFMMASEIILANHAKMGKTPSEILEATNDTICSNNRMEMFITVWLGILEISTGKLTASNAGHEYPAIKNGDGSFRLLRDTHGMVIGAMQGLRYKDYEMTLKPGSKLFVYTDGVPEATNENGELFTTRRMIEALNTDPDASPEQTLNNVRQAVDDFVRDAEQFDDMTMLCVELKQ